MIFDVRPDSILKNQLNSSPMKFCSTMAGIKRSLINMKREKDDDDDDEDESEEKERLDPENFSEFCQSKSNIILICSILLQTSFVCCAIS